MPTPTEAMLQMLAGLAEQTRNLTAIMAAPKVGTLPDGRVITIEPQKQMMVN
jgi:hypothetical protein